MNNYLKLQWFDIVLTLILMFLGGGVISKAYSFLAKILIIPPYVLSPLSTLTNYIFIFTVFYFIALNPRNEKFRIRYSFNNFYLFPNFLFLFIGQFLVSEFLTGLIPTQGKIFGNLYKIMTNALVGSINKYPFITFISVCIIAPVFEEIFFRGFILKGMLNNRVNPTKAIIISAFIFGGIHIFPWQVVGGILSGLILGLTFYKTGSLLICTLLHFLNNFFAFVLFMKYGSLETPDLGFNQLLLLPLGIGIVIIFGYLNLKFTKNYKWKSY